MSRQVAPGRAKTQGSEDSAPLRWRRGPRGARSVIQFSVPVRLAGAELVSAANQLIIEVDVLNLA